MPSNSPSVSPTKNPSAAPTSVPSKTPTASPTVTPTAKPSVSPSLKPSAVPSQAPTTNPTVTVMLEAVPITTMGPEDEQTTENDMMILLIVILSATAVLGLIVECIRRNYNHPYIKKQTSIVGGSLEFGDEENFKIEMTVVEDSPHLKVDFAES